MWPYQDWQHPPIVIDSPNDPVSRAERFNQTFQSRRAADAASGIKNEILSLRNSLALVKGFVAGVLVGLALARLVLWPAEPNKSPEVQATSPVPMSKGTDKLPTAEPETLPPARPKGGMQ